MVRSAFKVWLSLVIVLVCTVACSDNDTDVRLLSIPSEVDLQNSFYYEIDLTDRSDDTFKVRMFVNNLTEANKVFQFPATVPGVYAIFDIGRFVTKFEAYNHQYKKLGATNISTNQWELTSPGETRVIEFEVKETFDTPVDRNQLYKMGGTSIEDDHVLLNTFDVLGYPTGLKDRDIYLNVRQPAGWSSATSLEKKQTGLYFADDYDSFVDSPLLFGKLTLASTQVDATTINIATYSENDVISSGQLLNDVNQVLKDARAFLGELPVDRYNFLYYFGMFNAGALEHSYSSVYVLSDAPYSVNYGRSIRNISAHEFFHIVTPLNIHSEIISNFNFAEPTASEHLWFYEGVTEWASLMMQYRNNSITLNTLLNNFSTKKAESDSRFDANVSLSAMSLTCYTTGQSQFSNVYRKGALVAALLDIKLLELSGGTKGLRELILELIETYGPDQAFPENAFYEKLVQLTDPEIQGFFDDYVKGTTALPLTESFGKIGITYNPTTKTFTALSTKTPEQQLLFEAWRVNL